MGKGKSLLISIFLHNTIKMWESNCVSGCHRPLNKHGGKVIPASGKDVMET